MGREGRAVTATGRLRMADARELVDVLGTGDRTEGVRSSNDLPRLGLLVEWAKKARLVRVAKGRLYAVAKARPVLADPLQLWLRAFDALFELRQALIGARSGWHIESMLFDIYDEMLEDVLNTLYSLPYPMPWPRLRDSVHLGYRARFQLDSRPGPPPPNVVRARRPGPALGTRRAGGPGRGRARAGDGRSGVPGG